MIECLLWRVNKVEVNVLAKNMARGTTYRRGAKKDNIEEKDKLGVCIKG